MLDIKLIKNDVESVIDNLNRRGGDFSYLRDVKAFYEEKLEIISKVEVLKATRNSSSKLIGKYKKEKKDTKELMDSIANIGDEIKELDNKLLDLTNKIDLLVNKTPNLIQEDTPKGLNEDDNLEIRRVLDQTKFDFEPKAHWELAKELNIIDFERAAKITGSRFAIYVGLGARLERALINFFLDTAIDNGYTELLTPVIVNKSSLFGTGQLPKFEDDLFKIANTDYYLISTGEVPATNFHANEIINVDEPKLFTTYTACFRKEAGSAGRDTRGIIRQHQFNKVELVKFCKPSDTANELEKLTANAEQLLKLLKLPYRVVRLCEGDVGFTSNKTYDIEVFLPSYNDYKEISSCSSFGDFQARRANIRFKNENGKNEYVNTINGSGLAVGRCVAAIMENYQQADGSIKIPEILIPYMRCDVIKK